MNWYTLQPNLNCKTYFVNVVKLQYVYSYKYLGKFMCVLPRGRRDGTINNG